MAGVGLGIWSRCVLPAGHGSIWQDPEYVSVYVPRTGSMQVGVQEYLYVGLRE